MKNNKKAKFFCENCGSEVPENAKFCKNCGKFFSAVRCPKCGCTGRSQDFKKGCPKCGYAVSNDFVSNENSKTEANATAIASIFNSISKNKKNTFEQKSKTAFQKTETSLPLWIYLVTTALLFTMIFAVYSCIR